MEKEQVYNILNKCYFSENMHEKEIIDDLPSLLQGVNSFVDIGSSLGQYVFFANKYIKNGTIFAIEPDPIRYEELERNCKKWETQFMNNNKLIAINGAVAEEDCEITFYSTDNSMSGGLFPHKSRSNVNWDEIMVKGLKLDNLFKEDAPDFVKMDVEGVELRVLKGARKILKNGRTNFLIELHGWVDPEGQKNKNEVYKFLEEFGYRPVKVYENTRVLFVKE